MRYPWAPDTPIRVGWIAALLAATWAGGVAWSKRRADLVAAVIILVTVALLYSPSIRYGFLRDDFLFARPLSTAELSQTFWGDWAFGHGTQYYRPIVAASLALDYATWGPRPEGYHLTSLLIFSIAGVLGFGLLKGLTGSAPAALVGVVAWLCHPMSVAAAVWANQRTDSIMTVFYLATLWLISSPRFRLPVAAAAVGTGALALGSKEMAVTLPVLAAAMLLSFHPRADRRRWYGVAALAVLTAVYLLFWASLFPEKASRTSAPTDAGIADFLPRLLVPIVFPVDYETWLREWRTGDAMWWALGLLAFVSVVACAVLVRLGAAGAARAVAFAFLWMLLTPIPTFARKTGVPDVYRLGFLIAFGFAILASAIAAALESRPLLRCAFSGALALWLVPLANTSSSAWSPGGFHYQQLMRWDRDNVPFQQSLTPEMRRRFQQQYRNNVRDP